METSMELHAIKESNIEFKIHPSLMKILFSGESNIWTKVSNYLDYGSYYLRNEITGQVFKIDGEVSVTLIEESKSQLDTIDEMNDLIEETKSQLDPIAPIMTTQEKLVSILTRETQSLKAQYIKLNLEWAQADHEEAIRRSKFSDIEWMELMGITPEVRNPGSPFEVTTFPKGFWNRPESKKYDTTRSAAWSTANRSLEEHLKRTKISCEAHYESSILKLAFRIEKKGLNMNDLKVETSHIGVNIETTLTDGTKTVRAWTIIASGEIQKPHYRYLIK